MAELLPVYDRPLRHLRLRARRWRRALLAAALLLAAAHFSGALGEKLTPLQQAIVQGGDSAGRAAAERLLADARGTNLMAPDLLPALRNQLKVLPGVCDARLEREPPHTLHVSLVPCEPFMRWQHGSHSALVSAAGRRFDGAPDTALPVIEGESKDIPRMVAFYKAAQPLMQGAVVQIRLDARGGWQVFLNDGVLLNLGSRPEAALARYARAAAALHARLPGLQAVDMRYRRGFAVQVGAEEEDEQ